MGRPTDLDRLLAHAPTATEDPGPPADAGTATFAGRPAPNDPQDRAAVPAGGPDPDAATAPGGSAAHPDLPPPPPGGRYRPLRLHRSGGLGAVWVARDEVVGRDVALKTIRPGRPAGPAQAARFVREARVTGRLEHPGIVPLYDLSDPGPEGGGPCYVMRLVAGRTLAEAAAAYHRDRAAGRAGPLDLAALLDAVVAVARAVGFAHARGVLHRDLKGQNVVLGDFGEVFLLDWGLAKEEGAGDDPAGGGGTGSSDDTQPGSVLGTPGFMAPEVAAGGPSTRSADVYGLGGVLYQVLTGRPPYEGGTAQEILRRVAAEDPRPVQTLNPAAPAALVAVCHTALTRNPAARYPSAEALATDVRRWLADEPVSVYREPWVARAGRWARRHRTGVAVAAALLLAVAVGSAAAAGLVWREKERTAAEWHRAERERQRAEENFAVAWDLTTNLDDLVERTETGQDPARPSDPARKRWLDKALAVSERLRADAPDDPDLQQRTARLFRFSANLCRLVNDTDGAARSYREAVRLQAGLADRHPETAAYQEHLSHTLRDQANFLRRLGRLSDAAAAVDRAVDLAVGLRGADPGRPAAIEAEALARLDRAEIESARGRFAEAEASAAAAAKLFDELVTGPPTPANRLDRVFREMSDQQTAKARRGAAGAGAGPAALAPTLVAHDEAVRRGRVNTEESKDRDVLHNYYRALAERARTALRVPDRRGEALANLDEAAKGWDELTRASPTIPMYREGSATALLLRGRLRTALGDREGAATDLAAATRPLEDLVRANLDLPGYRVLLGELWVGRAEAATTPADLDTAVDLALSSFRAARNREGENPAHGRALADVEKRWPEAAARSAAKRKEKPGKP